MATRNPNSWMWAEACEMLNQAQRLQRQFFRFGRPLELQPQWEPPLDMVSYGREVRVTVALPGVVAEHIRIRIEQGALSVIANRLPPMSEHATQVHSLEIPYGRFERRILLPAGRYELVDQTFTHGCLILRLMKH